MSLLIHRYMLRLVEEKRKVLQYVSKEICATVILLITLNASRRRKSGKKFIHGEIGHLLSFV